MPTCPDCGGFFQTDQAVRSHRNKRPISCTMAAVTESPRARRARILAGVKRKGIRVVARYLQLKSGFNRNSSEHRALVRASNALHNGANSKKVVKTLQTIGDILIHTQQGRVHELDALQAAANALGAHLDLAIDSTFQRRPRRATRLFPAG